MSRYRFTSESVTEGHPDKLCDAISDAVLDAILKQDPKARVACESLAKTGMVVVAGEITTNAVVEYPVVVRNTVREIGYTGSHMGFDAETCAVLVAVEKQSPDISQGVTEGEGLHKEQGAGDQGLMFGFAVDETPNLMPAPIDYAHQLAKELASVRKTKKVDFLRPDGKTQVTLEYEDDRPVRIDAIVVSTQHDEDVKYKHLREAVMELVIEKVLPKKLLDKNTKFHVNPTWGCFVIGVGRRGTAGSPGGKSSSIATVVWAVTAAAHSAARTRARSTVRPATTRATWPRTSSPAAWPASARCRWPTRSGWRGPSV